MSYKKIGIVDMSILNRITEEDVCMWLAAQMQNLRNQGVPIGHVDVACWFRDYRDGKYYDTCFNGHDPGHCLGWALTHPTLNGVARELRRKALGDPSKTAECKRREARALLKEAEELEQAAKGILPICTTTPTESGVA